MPSINLIRALHKCTISPYFDFELYESSEVTSADRKRLGLPDGTGTVVTLEIKPSLRIPSADNLEKNLGRLVALRDILNDPTREVWLRDGRWSAVLIEAPSLVGKDPSERVFRRTTLKR